MRHVKDNKSKMDSDPELMVPVLQVDLSGSDEDEFDLNVPPSTGSEYLRRVRLEARRCPDVVVATIDPDKINCRITPRSTKRQSSAPNIALTDGKGCEPAPNGYAPSLQWQRQQVADFSDVRLQLSLQKLMKTSDEKRTLPSMDDDVGWCEFCFGSQREKESDDSHQGLLPLVSVVVKMSQPLIEQVLDYHLSWFETTGFSPAQGVWFYALLACLEKPLTPDACSSLRTLVRYCANTRAIVDKDDARLPHLNLLICLVTRYFDQTDLADE